MRRIAAMLTIVVAVPLTGQEPYRTPPAIVQRILDAPTLPVLSVSPGGVLLLAERGPLSTIADLSRPMLRLAGRRVDPATSGTFATTRGYVALTLWDSAGTRPRPVALPPDARVGDLAWSPDGRWLAFTITGDEGIALWIADARAGEARALTPPLLNAVLGSPCSWMPDARSLLCVTIPADRGAVPQEAPAPVGPVVQRNEGRVIPVPTYQDLLSSPHDEALFTYYATGRLALVEVATGTATPIGDPGIFLEATPAPGGRYLLIRRVTPPFSYQVRVTEFPQEVEVWSPGGERLATIASLPLADRVPVDGVRTGPRDFEWRPGEEATVVYIEALDGGDNRRPADVRDRLVSIAAPFTAPVELGRLNFRYDGIAWGRDGVALVSEYDWKTRRTRTWRIDTSDLAAGWRILFDRSREDAYGDPGTPVMTTDATGHRVLLQSGDGRWIYLDGDGAAPEGARPFLDRMHLENRKTERLWRSAEDAYESVVAVLDSRARRVITRRETRTTPPNYYLWDLRARIAPRPLTERENPVPELASIRREVVRYARGDGVPLSATLYLPVGYADGQQVPVVLWVYPREYASADAGGQVRSSPNRFLLPTGASHLFLLTQGYAVLDNPTLPVLGADTANDSYVRQTVMGAEAAVAYLRDRGIADGRFGVGGHSYGAFATANLLAHSDLFKAGIARSGAYNRTLTPFGFQSERRTFWEARDVYLEMMPFTYADRIDEPILLIHGMVDNNSGTFPIQSERMYAALKGFGATVEYVQLPFESHGYAARESIGDVVARMIEWYDKYVRDKPRADSR